MNIESLYQKFLDSSGISTDSRKINKNSIFFALKGENFNGNLYAEEALKKGASYAIIDEEQYYTDLSQMILVNNVLEGLQKLANYHRKKLNTPIIALTGSNGKTTTKELIFSVLSEKYKTQATVGNFNNHIGVPITLLSLKPETEFAVVEMGANHPGEINKLCEIIEPDYGFITNFGKAHLEGFGSLLGVIKGKTELYRYLDHNDKKVFINGRDNVQLAHSEHMNRIVFGTKEDDFFVELIKAEGELQIKFKNELIQTHLSGIYNYENIAAAIAIGAYFNVPDRKLKSGIENYIPKNNRSEIIKKGTNTIFLDAYNANPTSMMAAIENFKNVDSLNKILILGDMFELGSRTAIEHQAIVNFLSDNFIGRTYFVGNNFAKTTSEIPFIEMCKTFEDLEKELQKNPPQSAYILIKGSRGMALERVLNLL